MSTSRIQLTLYADASEASEVERIRREFNPQQCALIAAHVTLCREEELTRIDEIRGNLNRISSAQAGANPLVLHFGPPIRFADNKGVLLPARGDLASFHRLRSAALRGVIEQPRHHAPHLTLMHPRNSSCTDELFLQIHSRQLPTSLTFTSISLIEQVGSKPWRTLAEFPFSGPLRDTPREH